MSRVLIVEDEPVIAIGLRDSIEADGYRAEVAANGKDGFERARTGAFDLVLLDVMLPGRDGLSVCRELRASGVATPIILLTAKGQDADKIRGLDLGADDYITKPFSRGELLARMRAVLRRPALVAASSDTPDPFAFGGVIVHFARHEARCDGRMLDLTPTEFRLLRLFIARRGNVVTHDEIIREVWGDAAFLSDRVLYTHVNNLRGKIEAEPSRPKFLTGVRGVGYRFDTENGEGS